MLAFVVYRCDSFLIFETVIFLVMIEMALVGAPAVASLKECISYLVCGRLCFMHRSCTLVCFQTGMFVAC